METEVMTDKQFIRILKMVGMILDGCENLDEAKRKIRELSEDREIAESSGDGKTDHVVNH